MVLHSTSPKFTEPPEPRDENLVQGAECPDLHNPELHKNDRADGPSPRAIRDGAAGPQDIRSQKKVVAADLALDWVLEEIVQQARLATTATGAFIGVLRGHKIVCQATSGSTAGEFVAYLHRDRRMVDACLRTSDLQRCRDSETSEELDGSACRYVGARSIVLVPILDEAEEKLGVFGVFSPQADAFSSANIVALQTLSRRIADAMAQVDRCTSAASSGDASAPPRPAQPLRAARRTFAALRGPAVWGFAILAVVLLVGWTLSRALGQRAMHTSARAPEVITSQAASSVPAPPPPEHSSSDRSSPENAAANPQPRPALVAVAKPAIPATTANVKPVKAAKAIKKTPASPGLQVPDLEIENELDDASSGSLQSGSADAAKGRDQPSTNVAPRSVKPDKKTISMVAGSPPAPNNASSGSPPREAVHLTRDPEPPRATTPLSETGQNASSMNASSPNAGSPSAGPVMIPEKTALERVVERAEPDYPEDAKAQHVQGAVTVDVVVGRDGEVEGATPVDGDSRLQASAVKAMRKWHFAPLLRDGHFLSFESHITLHFVLP